MSDHVYSTAFYDRHTRGAIASARAMVPTVVDLVRPRSVVDVGCGIGAWLSVFYEAGVHDVVGIDGPYVDRSQLLIPASCFIGHDLEQPIALQRQFDLVVSLEVAEHLSPDHAGRFVESLAGLGRAVLFSAAIPGQGGEHHVNEQWPQYWAAKFAEHGFVGIDCMRARVWNREDVDWWYAQNSFLYVDRGLLQNSVALQSELAASHMPLGPVVHPRQFETARWTSQALPFVEDLLDAVPVGAGVVLVDDYQLSDRLLRAWRMRRLMDCDGTYRGPPASADAALRDLAAKQADGARFLVIAWSAFWWLDHYAGLSASLRARYRCVLENDRLVVFSLAGDAGEPGRV